MTGEQYAAQGLRNCCLRDVPYALSGVHLIAVVSHSGAARHSVLMLERVGTAMAGCTTSESSQGKITTSRCAATRRGARSAERNGRSGWSLGSRRPHSRRVGHPQHAAYLAIRRLRCGYLTHGEIDQLQGPSLPLLDVVSRL